MQLGCIIITTILMLSVIINLFVTLVIFIAEDQHVIDHVKVYQVFQTSKYRKLRSYLMEEQYVVLVGSDQSGVKNFIQHQANLQTQEGRGVILKRYQTTSKTKKSILSKIKETHYYMEVALGVKRKERTQIFFLEDYEEMPREEIEWIRERHPKDNIIIVTDDHTPVKIEKFKKKVFPAVTKKEMKQFMLLFYSMSGKQADRLFAKYGDSCEKVFEYFKRKAEDSMPQGTVEHIGVDDVQEMNNIAHQVAERKSKQYSEGLENQNNQKAQQKKQKKRQKAKEDKTKEKVKSRSSDKKKGRKEEL